MSPMLFIPDDDVGSSAAVWTPGESGDSARSSSRFMATPICSEDGHPQPSPFPPMPSEPVDSPKVSFDDLATRYRQNQHKLAQRKRLEYRLHASKVSIGASARLIRVGAALQRGLVDCLKHEDKINFVSLYHTLHDVQDSCDAAFRRHFHRQDPLEDWSPASDSAMDHSPDFFLQLSPQSRADLLGILQLVRSDPQFLYERLSSLSSAQLAALVSSASSLEAADPVFPSSSRSRSQFSFSKRNLSSPLTPFKDHALAFERTDALSALLFNVYAAPLDSDAPEARLRLDVWSSVCAKLIAHGGSRYYPLVGHILSAWAMCSEWKARPKFELYLMDILQTGAFLLEHIDNPPGMSFGAEPIDPLRTDVAEEFFASAVNSLFDLLDDPDGGFPHAVMEFGSAILQKLDRPDCHDRFLEYLFVQWFFSKFLYGALTYPEAHGLLLDFHIRKDARDKLLGQVGLQAYSQVFAVLHSMNHFSMARPAVREHVENMLHRFKSTASRNLQGLGGNASTNYSRMAGGLAQNSPSVFLMLSAPDILTLLNALFPRTYSVYNSPTSSSGLPTLSLSSLHSHSERAVLAAEPGFFRPKVDSASRYSPNSKTMFPTEMNFLSPPENCLSQNANRIRFELSDLAELDDRTHLDHPSAEDWAIFSIAPDGKRLVWGLFPDGQSSVPEDPSIEDVQSTTLGIEDNYEALQTAIVKLVKENPAGDHVDYDFQFDNNEQADKLSLKQRFDRAMSHCHHDSDFIGAHYWWNAARQLRHSVANSLSRRTDDSWILDPMYTSCSRSLHTSRSVIDRCEGDFVTLDRNMQRLQKTVRSMMATVGKLRNKMWYMTDVKNSMRYEDAKNVALALKNMIYSALFKIPDDHRSRSARSLGGSLLQKPELQVMNVMKAPSSQGGPNKLSDDQVDLTRKWLSHNGVDNFCRGEERIHRFCYEVKTSINRLVGETMAETPVLWSSELFQRERSKYEGHSNRGFLGLSSSNLRPFSISSEDSISNPPSYGPNLRASDSISRFSQDAPSLNRKTSFQSLLSDKWKSPATETSSIGGSPGRTASISTGDSCSTFWSTPHQPPQYAASASSFYSRPPSMVSDMTTHQPRRVERKTHGKIAFLDELKQALTSLLLSDLGSPVWSCGSETDAWFGNALDQKRIKAQMEKRARIQRFYDDYDQRSTRQTIHRTPSNGRRSKSIGPEPRSRRVSEDSSSTIPNESTQETDSQSPFAYKTVFRQLIEVFSRHGNPFVKLKALRDLRALVVASLNSSNEDHLPFAALQTPTSPRVRNSGISGNRPPRYSFSEPRTSQDSEKDILQTPKSPAAESVVFESRPSDYSTPTESQIVDALRGLLLEIKPKTLFRDLQFISAFVPGETLNKTDSGTAFLQFGLAAMSLKDEVCNSMIEIADKIVSQELTRRHPPQGYDSSSRPNRAIEDAAGMWIITAKEGNPVAQRELGILYLTHPELLPRVTLPLTSPRDTFKADMMYHRDKDSKSDPLSMCLALHWMQLSASGGDELARNRLREREEFDSIA
ncbi:hypothetical protein MW887_007776 [Aspergillus wentii]|nr:hypothetical protein MW887_007776 [Aspergillus wentii]